MVVKKCLIVIKIRCKHSKSKEFVFTLRIITILNEQLRTCERRQLRITCCVMADTYDVSQHVDSAICRLPDIMNRCALEIPRNSSKSFQMLTSKYNWLPFILGSTANLKKVTRESYLQLYLHTNVVQYVKEIVL